MSTNASWQPPRTERRVVPAPSGAGRSPRSRRRWQAVPPVAGSGCTKKPHQVQASLHRGCEAAAMWLRGPSAAPAGCLSRSHCCPAMGSAARPGRPARRRRFRTAAPAPPGRLPRLLAPPVRSRLLRPEHRKHAAPPAAKARCRRRTRPGGTGSRCARARARCPGCRLRRQRVSAGHVRSASSDVRDRALAPAAAAHPAPLPLAAARTAGPASRLPTPPQPPAWPAASPRSRLRQQTGAPRPGPPARRPGREGGGAPVSSRLPAAVARAVPAAGAAPSRLRWATRPAFRPSPSSASPRRTDSSLGLFRLGLRLVRPQSAPASPAWQCCHRS